MEAKKCNVYDLDADALLPPRKRLLAGLKRQSCGVHCPAPSASHMVDAEYETHVNNFLRARLINPNLTNDEIVETSRSAAIEAVKVAEAARANAEIKAAKAAKAMAAAKSALDLVTTLSEEAVVNKEKPVRKCKMKKHVTVEALYNKNKGNTNPRTDEELALKLHQAINSSSRTMKCASASRSITRCAVSPVEVKGFSLSTRDGIRKLELNAEAPLKEIDMITVDLNSTKPDSDDEITLSEGDSCKKDQVKLENREPEVPSLDKSSESVDITSKKRGRIKQKKLSLNICNFGDQTNIKDVLKPQATQPSEDNASMEEASSPIDTSAKSLITVQGAPTWKCQDFKSSPCVTQNKVMQS